MKIYQIPFSVVLLFALAACAGAPAATSVPADPATQAPTSTTVPAGDSEEVAGTPEFADTPTPDPAMAEVILIVKADLADRSGVDQDLIELLKSVAIIWPDASLGCPEPGKSYVQQLSPGYLIVLKAGKETYEYHTDGEADVVLLCNTGENTRFPDIPLTPGEIQDGQPWLPVE